jgi:hypothetical protein
MKEPSEFAHMVENAYESNGEYGGNREGNVEL